MSGDLSFLENYKVVRARLRNLAPRPICIAPPPPPPADPDPDRPATARKAIGQIIAEVCARHSGVLPRDIMLGGAGGRRHRYSRARQEIFHLAGLEGFSNTQIGSAMGGFDPTSVWQGMRAYRRRNGIEAKP